MQENDPAISHCLPGSMVSRDVKKSNKRERCHEVTFFLAQIYTHNENEVGEAEDPPGAVGGTVGNHLDAGFENITLVCCITRTCLNVQSV